MKLPPRVCPCCRQPLPGRYPRLEALLRGEAVGGARLSRMERRVAQAVVTRSPSLERLTELVYMDEPTGGPEGAERVISVLLHKIRGVVGERALPSRYKGGQIHMDLAAAEERLTWLETPRQRMVGNAVALIRHAADPRRLDLAAVEAVRSDHDDVAPGVARERIGRAVEA